ncbi:DUF2951 family protein [Staphylococcus ureilyticus]|uniref:DUF2951 family protein n=1 Tax=Staphylococcus ureilyticus TaxID=94138 RepID=UPI0021D35E43|nr:DUF2951 family protein [Staphylococcus ureilyticus]UXS61038.1 DUF2951 family protein [Staphylococcus ureilyticus]
MDSWGPRINTVEREIKELKEANKELKKTDENLKQRIDKNFKELDNKLDVKHKEQNEYSKELVKKLDDITSSQTDQKLINQELRFTLNNFNEDLKREREEKQIEKKEREQTNKEIKNTRRWTIGMVVSFLIPLSIAIIQYFFL